MAIVESILARLKNKAAITDMPFQAVLRLFLQEEFLLRLSKSKYVDNFTLKGGLYIYTLTNFTSRVTIDVDFLMRKLSNEIANMEKVIVEIINTKTSKDYIIFEYNKIHHIIPALDYNGVSFQLMGRLGKTKTPFTIDIGVGDIIFPASTKREIPNQLEGFEAPVVNTYSLESTVAEKLHSILLRLGTTSRMKDFYDIYYISKLSDFNGQELEMAIIKTFENRNMMLNQAIIIAFEKLQEDPILASRWKRYLETLNAIDISFNSILDQIVRFIKPALDAYINHGILKKNWSAQENTWTI